MSVILIDSYNESNGDSSYIMHSDYVSKLGQSFLATLCTLSSCKFHIHKTGSITGNIYAKLYAHTGVFGESSLPTGNPLATSDAVNVSTLGAYPPSLVTFNFTGEDQVVLSGGTHYVIVLDCSSIVGDGSNCVGGGFDGSSPSHNGNLSYEYEESWSDSDIRDTIFYVYGEEESTPIVGEKYPLPPFKNI